MDPFTRIANLLAADTQDFPTRVRISGLDPETDFIGADLRHVRFGPDTDLSGFVFDGADLRGTDIANTTGAAINPATRLPANITLRPPPDFDEAKACAMILAGTMPPRPWLPFIRELNLGGQKEFRRLAPLAGCFNLRKLDLDNTQVSDLAHIAALANLRAIYLHGTNVSDLTPLTGLAKLEDLRLENTTVSDLTPIAGLTALRRLALDNTNVSDLAPIAGLANLQHLSLNTTTVRDFAPIARLAKLQYLRLKNTTVRGLEPIAGLTNLQHLDLDNTSVDDLAIIAGLANLNSLFLNNTQVSDLAPVAHLIDNGLTVLGKADLLKALNATKKRPRKP